MKLRDIKKRYDPEGRLGGIFAELKSNGREMEDSEDY